MVQEQFYIANILIGKILQTDGSWTYPTPEPSSPKLFTSYNDALSYISDNLPTGNYRINVFIVKS